MARLNYLLRRGGSYSARIRVPLDLVEILGRKELVKALGTSDHVEAKRRLLPVLEGWHRQFDDLRARRAVTDDDKAHATWAHYAGALDRDEASRQSYPDEADIEAERAEIMRRAEAGEIAKADPLTILDATLDLKVKQEWGRLDAEARRVKLAELRKHLRTGNMALINHEVAAYIQENELLVEEGSPDWKALAHRMMRAEIEALQRTLERDEGDYGGQPRDPIVTPFTSAPRAPAKPGETVMEVFDIFARENPRKVAQDRLNQMRRDLGLFVDVVGRNLSVTKIDKAAVREWKTLLISYPVKATETKDFAGLTMRQTVEHNERVGKPVISDRTVNRYLSSLGAFCDWCVKNGYLDQNPVNGMALPKERTSKTLPFTSEQLNALFASPLFTGCLSGDEWRNLAKPGNVQVRDHRHWVPLIMLFSGARPGEIAQLAVSDVRQQHGHWIMHITTEGEGDKSVKTEGSMRVVPIHPELVRLGFIKYRDEQERAGSKRLFPGAQRNARGQMMADFSREFGRYLERIGIKEGRGLSLYSFRHGATDALRRAGYLDEQFGFILGHTGATMTGRYGILPQGMLEQRVELINAIGYHGLSLRHLAET
ncbi:DUF6538 domain-containing protein [Acidimangrovimonas pyrenivorans]|uniref:DUF6538 domain-containing protein n=1 Tax=Acidimangrovimonas pyrenivorans TaxID=2030798 RepID=A0ABV7AFL4_9RHOB